MRIFDLDGYTFTYRGARRAALRDVSAGVDSGEFVAVCGKSGSGKSTLLRSLAAGPPPEGESSGELLFCGRPLLSSPRGERERRVGYVTQDPCLRPAAGTARLGLAAGMERLGFAAADVRMRVAEMACFFGIQHWLDAEISELSGGQRQTLNLAALMALRPDAVVLDEPAAQLDPIAASEFLEMLRKINRETGVAVVISEHRLEDLLPLSDRALVLDGGAVIADAPPGQAGAALARRGHDMFMSMPTPMRVFMELEGRGLLRREGSLPVTVREGREGLTAALGGRPLAKASVDRPPAPAPGAGRAAIEARNAWFRYDRHGDDVIRGLSFRAEAGRLSCISGGNGVGKSTALMLMCGAARPYRGGMYICGSKTGSVAPDRDGGPVAALPQDPRALLGGRTLRLCLEDAASRSLGGPAPLPGDAGDAIEAMAGLMELDGLLDRSPDAVSGGERQRAALAATLLRRPGILLLDEPTKGMDSHFKEKFAALLKGLLGRGATAVMVSHDIEFCARHADVCALFFDGAVVSSGAPGPFFSGNSYYTTAANRMSRHIFSGAVTAEEVVGLCAENLGGPVNTRCFSAL
ncbi:MAG: ATP-binding cassette domain-containing protein [Clostridiales Family XIII bacterium]|jgi:energy-coupling factor transport system ATP-binding protein|nr:ATP-binding cassette domain-containing protein [Clostridiales Family XIII bacterium]